MSNTHNPHTLLLQLGELFYDSEN